MSKGSVLKLLEEFPRLTRDEIVEKTGLCKSVVGNNLRSLHGEHLVKWSRPYKNIGDNKTKVWEVIKK